MLHTDYQIEYFQDDCGKVPFRAWLDSLRDTAAVARIRVRLNRVRLGNFGVTGPWVTASVSLK